MIRLALAAIAIAAILGWLGPALDEMDDHSDEVNQVRNIEEAQRAAQAQRRFEQAAQHICGPQAAWAMVTNDTVQCRNKYGRKTVVARITKE